MSKYSEQVRQDAKAAADYIREHGWCQHTLRLANGSCCANGAVDAVTGGDDDRLIALQEAFISVVGGHLVYAWNDKPGRTKEEVLAVFDKIANS